MAELTELQGATVNWLSRRPKWQQWLLFIAMGLAGLLAVEQGKEFFSDSPRAKLIKKQIRPIAEQLDQSAKVGRVMDAANISDQISDVLHQYNSMAEEGRAAVNNSPLKYCLIAVLNLSDGMDEISRYKTWVNRDKYLAALNQCK